MSAGISAECIKNALFESDKDIFLQSARSEYNISQNDGMTLKIAQDNLLDVLVNSVDGRRLKLEKQAEILTDYYGDRLLAKEIFQRYLSYKSWVGGAANLLTLGVFGANMWSRVMKNSVFMGKVGTLASVVALQAGSRYFTNNYLESEVSRPWKIHTHRMSKGLGPTNVPSNHHNEEITTPLRFEFLNFSPANFLFGNKVEYALADLDVKMPTLQKHYPFAPDEHDMRKLSKVTTTVNKRLKLAEPEDDGETIYIPKDAWVDYPFTKAYIKDYYPQEFEIFKSPYIDGDQTIYKPESDKKLIAFQPTKLENVLKGDSYVEENEYAREPITGDIIPDVPEYAKDYQNPINITEDRVKLLSIFL